MRRLPRPGLGQADGREGGSGIKIWLSQHLAGVIIYLLAVNLLALALFALDKRRACRGQWRIPERTLLALAVAGGSPGAWLGMRLFHHKTRHRRFSIGVPLILLLQLAAALWLICS